MGVSGERRQFLMAGLNDLDVVLVLVKGTKQPVDPVRGSRRYE
jgi:hypothetical protein